MSTADGRMNMISILSVNGETTIVANGELEECINQSLNIISELPISIAKRLDGTEEEKRELAIDILVVSAGATIHELYDGDLDEHIEAVRSFIESYINPEEAGEPEPAEPAQEETAPEETAEAEGK